MKKPGYLFKRLAGVSSMLVWLMSQVTPPIHSSDHMMQSYVATSAYGAIVDAASEHMLRGPEEAFQKRASQEYGKLSLYFEPNYGQTDSQTKFLSRGNGYTLFLTSTEAVLSLTREDGHKAPLRRRYGSELFRQQMQAKGIQPLIELGYECEGRKTSSVRMEMTGANADPLIEGVEQLPGISNYFIGNDPRRWRTNIPHYAGVKYHNVYPGADLVYYSNEGRLEYDFILVPGAEPGAIKLAFEGAQEVRIDDQGDLVLTTEAGELRQHKPAVYQEINGVKKEVAAGYVFCGKREVGFQVDDYDKSKPLVIDPILSYSTFLSGNDNEFGAGIAADASGNAYVTGITGSLDFPTTSDAYQREIKSFFDAFVTKLNDTGSGLIYSTFLGGAGMDGGSDITLDSSGDAYVTGETSSTNFPTRNPIQVANGGIFFEDAFVTRLNAAGSALVYSTYLGGSGTDSGLGITVDSAGNAYMIGSTRSPDFPTTPQAFQTAKAGDFNIFIAKVESSQETGGFGISSASVNGKKLFVFGEGFDEDAVILLDSRPQETKKSKQDMTVLIGKKTGKRIGHGRTVTIQVRNSDGRVTQDFRFTRPNR